jgi:drug/metabolite transporter (DMT)-like permease
MGPASFWFSWFSFTLNPELWSFSLNRHTTSGRWKLGLALVTLTAFMFGIDPIVMNPLFSKLDPITISWYRFTIAGISLGIVSFKRYDLTAPFKLRGKPLLLLTIAVLGLSGNSVLYTAGLEYSSPNTTQVVIVLAPILLMLGGLVIFKESFSRRQILGVVVLLVGLALFFDGKYDEILAGSSTLWLGILCVALSAAAWAAFGLAQKQLLTVLSSRAIIFAVYCLGSILYLLKASPTAAFALTAIEWGLLGLAAMVSVISFVSLATALDHLEASRVSVVLGTPPLFTIAAVAILAPLLPDFVEPEPISLATAAGIVLVVTGGILASLRPNNHQPG